MPSSDFALSQRCCPSSHRSGRSDAHSRTLRLLSGSEGNHGLDRTTAGDGPPDRKGRSRRLWGFHLSFTDRARQPVWHTLLGALVASHLDSNTPHRLDRCGRQRYSHPALPRATERLWPISKPPCDRSWNWPLAVSGRSLKSSRADEARLSATLLQRGLFDRRAERTLAAQRAVLDEALLRCRTRLDEIAATAQIVAETRATRVRSSSDDDSRRVRPVAHRVVHQGCASDARRTSLHRRRFGADASRPTHGKSNRHSAPASSVRAITDVALLPLVDAARPDDRSPPGQR